ncbi:MAG TPA: sugar phosphate isomerase/epimerase family protein [Stellaceae bacterium]|nr:sugar phosphate isomerase/epimerase family protein [Stellaceae bacterium]
MRDRIGVDIGTKLKLEDAIDWAAAHQVRWIDIQLDIGPNTLGSFDDARVAEIRRRCARHDLHLGLHTASSVNVAEYAPYLGDAVDRYLKAYIEIAPRLGAEWIVVHAGFHFTSDKALRMQAGLERLQRIAAEAERRGALILLENLNKEPDEAEVHYLAHTVDEWRHYFDRIDTPAFKLSFTVNHAHLVADGIAGFVDALDMRRVAEVRLADCWRNGVEVHLQPGDGDLDFVDMFARIEGKGFAGHYMCAFGSLDDMLKGRDDLTRAAARAGIAV